MRKAGYPTTEQGIRAVDPEMLSCDPVGGGGITKVSTILFGEPNQIPQPNGQDDDLVMLCAAEAAEQE